MNNVTIAFNAIGVEKNGQQYPCPFTITFPISAKPTQAQVQAVVQEQMKLFKEYHPTGQVISQRQVQHG